MNRVVNFGAGVWCWIVGLALAAALGGGCASLGDAGSRSGPEDAAALAESQTVLTNDCLRPNDLISIVFSGIPNPPEKHEERIKEDGTIKLPLLDAPIQASGKTVGQLQDDIYKLYVPKLFKRLTVTILTENRVFYVRGEVKMPSRYPYIGEITVLKAIAAAGDFTDFAAKSSIRLTRSNGQIFVINAQKALKNPRLDLPVIPGDVIYVPRRKI
jgi:protein involved in polysaccharide export with SLBB domain